MPPAANKPPCLGPITRRNAIGLGSLAFGLSWSDIFRLQAASAAAPAASDPAVIFLWLPGGPPHTETFDKKPAAPSEIRGAFKPIKTNVAGIEICELMPNLAKCADKYALIRSVAHAFADHGGGHKRFLTGRDPLSPVGFVNDYPAVPSAIAKTMETRWTGVPNYVAGTDPGREGIDVFSFGSAYLGGATHPFMVPGDPNAPDFEVRNLKPAAGVADKLEERAGLLAKFDRFRAEADRAGSFGAIDAFQQRALGLLASPKAREAFDIRKEPDSVREAYGRNVYGQRALLARRLVEAGCTFVTMVLENPMPGKNLP